MTQQDTEMWLDEARALAADIAGKIVASGGTVDDLVIFLTDPYQTFGFDVAVSVLTSTGLSREAAGAQVRSEMARTVAKGQSYGLFGVTLSRRDAAEALSEIAFDRDPAPFLEDELDPDGVRMIATRLGAWWLEQVGYRD
jgi:hypothetical protein